MKSWIYFSVFVGDNSVYEPLQPHENSYDMQRGNNLDNNLWEYQIEDCHRSKVCIEFKLPNHDNIEHLTYIVLGSPIDGPKIRFRSMSYFIVDLI